MKKRFRVTPSNYKDYYSINDTWVKETYVIENCTKDEAKELVDRLNTLHSLSESRYE